MNFDINIVGDLFKGEPVFIALKYVDLLNHILYRNREPTLPLHQEGSNQQLAMIVAWLS